jgi:lysophospholipid acyltransferase
MLRPFFMSPDGAEPTPNKIYYDIFSWFITQVSFAFTVSPFITLYLGASIKVWSRVYFYAIIGVVLSLAFLQSPGKAWLQSQVKKRTGTAKPAMERIKSVERMPTLGMPDDPEKEIDEIVREVKAEVERRKKEGIKVPDVRELITQILDEGKVGMKQS